MLGKCHVLANLCLIWLITMPLAARGQDSNSATGSSSRFHPLDLPTTNQLLNGVPERYQFLYLQPSDTKLDQPRIRSTMPFQKIELERTPSLSTRPAYLTSFTRDGDAYYKGDGFDTRTGEHNSEISLAHFATLCWAIERLGIVNETRQANYRTYYDTSKTFIRLTLSDGGKILQVTDYGNPPAIEIDLAASFIDRQVSLLRWNKKP